MKRLVVILTVALVLVFAVSAMAESTVVSTEEATETVKTESPKVDDKTSVDDGGSSDSSSSSSTTNTTTNKTTTVAQTAQDAALNDDVSKYANNPVAIIADYGITTFKEPVIYESVTTVGSKSGTLTITQQSLTEGDEVAVFVVYRINGKLVRVQLITKWVNGKLVCEIPDNVASEIDGKQIRLDVIGEAK